MAYLHSHHIIHRDLAARNVLCSDDEALRITCKVADFGLARVLNEEVLTIDSSAPLEVAVRWCAPEICSARRFSKPSDVFAFAMLMYECLACGQPPFASISDSRLVAQAIAAGQRPSVEALKPEPGVALLLAECWAAEPEERPTFRQISKRLGLLAAAADTAVASAQHSGDTQPAAPVVYLPL